MLKLDNLNILLECKRLRLKLWECPPFLFILMGFITIIAMVILSVLTQGYLENPEVPTIIGVTLVAVINLVMGQIIITGFNKVAQANQMKTEFIAIASHELRSPLAALNWTMEILERNSRNVADGLKQNQNPAETSEILGIIKSNTQRMIQLVNSLIDISKMEAGILKPKAQIFSLKDLTAKIVNDLISHREYYTSSNIDINIEAGGNMPEVSGDPEQIAIVIRNLINNALNYSHNSGKNLITVTNTKSSLLWSIRNNIEGTPLKIPNSTRPNHTSLARLKGGGFDFYMSEIILNQMGGKIGFDFGKNGEPFFWFTLPKK